MALPGLGLSSTAVPIVQETPKAVHELQHNTEWRFEAAFGENVEVRVCELLHLFGSN